MTNGGRICQIRPRPFFKGTSLAAKTSLPDRSASRQLTAARAPEPLKQQAKHDDRQCQRHPVLKVDAQKRKLSGKPFRHEIPHKKRYLNRYFSKRPVGENQAGKLTTDSVAPDSRRILYSFARCCSDCGCVTPGRITRKSIRCVFDPLHNYHSRPKRYFAFPAYARFS